MFRAFDTLNIYHGKSCLKCASCWKKRAVFAAVETVFCVRAVVRIEKGPRLISYPLFGIASLRNHSFFWVVSQTNYEFLLQDCFLEEKYFTWCITIKFLWLLTDRNWYQRTHIQPSFPLFLVPTDGKTTGLCVGFNATAASSTNREES